MRSFVSQRARAELDITGTDHSAAEAVDQLRVPSGRLELARSQSAAGSH